MNKFPDISIIILAAGPSTRFGSPKQLAKIGRERLLESVCQTAVSTGITTIVVLGANAKVIIDICQLEEAEVVINRDWEMGMSSSIKAGIEKALEIDPETNAVLLILGDQPRVTDEAMLRLIQRHSETGKPIAASGYADTVGTPAIFRKDVFEELLALSGEGGAKMVIEKYRPDGLTIVQTPEAEFDIDTMEDLNGL